MKRYRIDFSYGRYFFEQNEAGDWVRFEDHAQELENAKHDIEQLQAAASAEANEVERLRAALKTANANHERFEREWYLRGDEVERLKAEYAAYRADGEPELRAANAEIERLLATQLAFINANKSLADKAMEDTEEMKRLRAKLNFENREPPHCPSCDCSCVPQSDGS